MFLVKKEKGEFVSLPSSELNAKNIKAISSKLAQSILKKLAKEPSYPSKIAKELGEHEQKVYYHIRNLQKAKIINKSKEETKNGILVNYFSLNNPSYFVKFGEFKKTQRIVDIDEEQKEFLHPFIKNGELDALIVVGSPNPHGPQKERARDVNMAMDFALFLGTFLNHVPCSNVKLDIDVRSKDLMNNLIIIGGPKVNRVTNQINDKLPIYFAESKGYSLRSSITGELYSENECGLIVKLKNPFDPKKQILVIGGKSTPGTRASILAFLNNFSGIVQGNKENSKIMARVVEGVDFNSSGIIDKIEFKE